MSNISIPRTSLLPLEFYQVGLAHFALFCCFGLTSHFVRSCPHAHSVWGASLGGRPLPRKVAWDLSGSCLQTDLLGPGNAASAEVKLPERQVLCSKRLLVFTQEARRQP